MNGIDTAVAIREREKSRHIPIIFLTAHIKTDEIVFKGYSAGAVDFLIKPLRADILRAKVGVFVELALARQRLELEIAERTRYADEIAKLNSQLEAKNGELTEKVEELEHFSYSLSHDMRAPLRSMFGFSEILLEECGETLEPEHVRYLKKIIAGANRLDQLIQDVLNYSVVSRSAMKLGRVDVARLARDIIEQYPGFQEPDADVRVENELPAIMANEAALTQCLSNLIGNAIKFVQPGTKPQIRIAAERRGNRVHLWVSDNGIGIAPNDLDRIFGIFVKVHSADKYSGTGIGLSIVRRAAQRMNGKVGVESTPGSGSRFWLEFAAAE